jgi:Sec-independent protein translocase protein TatA
LFFGAKQVPELARSLGSGARELKNAAPENDEEENEAKMVSPAKDADEGKTRATISKDLPAERDGDRAGAPVAIARKRLHARSTSKH